MWFFMISCYALTLLTLIMMILTGIQGHFQFHILNANHPTFALLTIIFYLFTESLVIFYFVGTGVSIKDFTEASKLPPDYRKQSLKVKMRIYPPTLLNMFFVMALFISGGAVATGRLAGGLHGAFYCLCLAHFLYVIYIQHGCFKDETDVILRMSGIKPKS